MENLEQGLRVASGVHVPAPVDPVGSVDPVPLSVFEELRLSTSADFAEVEGDVNRLWRFASKLAMKIEEQHDRLRVLEKKIQEETP